MGQQGKKKGGSKKYGRNKVECNLYRQRDRRETNRKRRYARMEKAGIEPLGGKENPQIIQRDQKEELIQDYMNWFENKTRESGGGKHFKVYLDGILYPLTVWGRSAHELNNWFISNLRGENDMRSRRGLDKITDIKLIRLY